MIQPQSPGTRTPFGRNTPPPDATTWKEAKAMGLVSFLSMARCHLDGTFTRTTKDRQCCACMARKAARSPHLEALALAQAKARRAAGARKAAATRKRNAKAAAAEAEKVARQQARSAAREEARKAQERATRQAARQALKQAHAAEPLPGDPRRLPLPGDAGHSATAHPPWEDAPPAALPDAPPWGLAAVAMEPCARDPWGDPTEGDDLPPW